MDQSKTGMGEEKGSNLLQVGFFFLSIHFFKNMLVNIIFDPALLDLEVAIAKNVIYFPRNE